MKTTTLTLHMHKDSTGDRICLLVTDQKGKTHPVTITWSDEGFKGSIATQINVPLGAEELEGVKSTLHLMGLIATAMSDALGEDHNRDFEEAFDNGDLTINL